MVSTRKYSEFPSGNLDEAAGLAGGVNTRGAVSTGGSGGTSITVTQVGHGLDRGIWVRLSGGAYVVADAASSADAEVVGVVSDYIDANNFVLQQSGYIEDLRRQNSGVNAYLPLTQDMVYFLSETVAGELQSADVTTVDAVSKPCFIADGQYSGWVISLSRGQIQDGAGGGGGGGSSSGGNTVTFEYANSFSVGDVVRVSGSNTVANAQANNFTNSLSIGIVVAINVDGNPDKFTVQTEGYTDKLIGLVAPTTLYYLSDSVAGQFTSTKPTAVNSYIKPVVIGLTTNEAFILEQRTLPQTLVSNPNFVSFTQSSPSLALGDAVRISASNTYSPAQADSITNADAVGIIVYKDGNDYILQTEGYTEALGASPWFSGANTKFWLDASTAGQLTSTEPTTPGQASKPMFFSLTASAGYIQEQRPLVQPISSSGVAGDILGSFDFSGESSHSFDNIITAGYNIVDVYFIHCFTNGTLEVGVQVGHGATPTYVTNYSGGRRLVGNTSTNEASLGYGLTQMDVTGSAATSRQISTYPGSGVCTIYGVQESTVKSCTTQYSFSGTPAPGVGQYGAYVTDTCPALTSIRVVIVGGAFTSGRVVVVGRTL